MDSEDIFGPGSPMAIIDIFRAMDQNGDGLIDSDELKAIFLAINFPLEFLDVVVEAFDTNGDGVLSYDELIGWIFQKQEDLSNSLRFPTLDTTHIFLTPQDEARLERSTLWDLSRAENDRTMAALGLLSLDDLNLLVISVGSSSSQFYDASGLADSIPIGMHVPCCEASLNRFASIMRDGRKEYTQVILVNSIGYMLKAGDPCKVPLDSPRLARDHHTISERAVVLGYNSILNSLWPEAETFVLNRAKDPHTKRYKYPQLANGFSESLASGCRISGLEYSGDVDAIIDWGGASFKIHAGGKRIATELYNANTLLCDGNVLCRDQLAEGIKFIEKHTVRHLPAARRIVIVQTGKARELALRE